jgi:hypothetical protein
MEELLANPAVQAGVAPFLSALAVAAALRRTRLLGVAVALAFALVIALTVGYAFEPLTATRKLVVIGLCTALVVLALEVPGAPPTPAIRATLAAAAATAAVWMVWRVLLQQEPAKAALYGLAAGAYIALLLESGLRASGDGIRAASTSMMLGLTAGVLALLGASALLAQVGIAVAAGAGAVLLVQMMGLQRGPTGWTLVLPAATIAGLAGLLAVFTGSLPWFCLLPTLGIPWAAKLVRQERRPPWLAALLTALAGLIPMLLAVGLAWFAAQMTT